MALRRCWTTFSSLPFWIFLSWSCSTSTELLATVGKWPCLLAFCFISPRSSLGSAYTARLPYAGMVLRFLYCSDKVGQKPSTLSSALV